MPHFDLKSFSDLKQIRLQLLLCIFLAFSWELGRWGWGEVTENVLIELSWLHAGKFWDHPRAYVSVLVTVESHMGALQRAYLMMGTWKNKLDRTRLYQSVGGYPISKEIKSHSRMCLHMPGEGCGLNSWALSLERGTPWHGSFLSTRTDYQGTCREFFPIGLSSRMDSSLSHYGAMRPQFCILTIAVLSFNHPRQRHSSCLMEDLQKDRLYNFPAENTSMLLSTQALKRTSSVQWQTLWL